METRKQMYEYQGESSFIYGIGILTLLVVLIITIGLSIELKPIGIMTSVIILLIVLIVMRKIVKKVTFSDNAIEVIYLFNNTINVPYSVIYEIYYNKEGFLPSHVYVIRYKSGNGKKKVTFYTDIEEMITLKEFLVERGMKESRISVK
jgi:hypothetical protein